MKAKRGHPTKYNAETLDRLCDALAQGHSIKEACIMAAVGVQTLADWRKRIPPFPGLEQRLNQAREAARQKAMRSAGLHDPQLPKGNYTTGGLNWAGEPMLRGDSYGGRIRE